MTRTARRRRPGLTAPAPLIGVGCSELGAGGCEHIYRDPLLAITAAADEASGVHVSPLRITVVAVGGQLQPVGYLLATAFGARAAGDTMVCHMPCGFGTSEGRYAFTSAASGYVSRTVTTEARYPRCEGGCPSHIAGSTRTRIVLTRNP